MTKDELSSKITAHMISKGSDETTVSFYGDICTINVCTYNHGLGEVISFSTLKWLSELFGTDKIDIKDQHHTSGCDTCDYGATDVADIVCYEIKTNF